MDEKAVRNWVTVIVVLGYVMFSFLILGGFILLVGGGSIGALIAGLVPDLGALGVIITGFSVAFGLVIAAIGVLCIFINKALGDYKNWARWTVVVFSAFGFVGSLGGLPFSILTLLIDGFLVYFFGFDPTVNRLYTETKKPSKKK